MASLATLEEIQDNLQRLRKVFQSSPNTWHLQLEQLSNPPSKTAIPIMRTNKWIQGLKCQCLGHEEHQCPNEDYDSREDHALFFTQVIEE